MIPPEVACRTLSEISTKIHLEVPCGIPPGTPYEIPTTNSPRITSEILPRIPLEYPALFFLGVSS